MTDVERQSVQLAVVMPVGPQTKLESVYDSLESIEHFTAAPRCVVLVDDSGEGLGEEVRTRFPDIELVVTSGASGIAGGLYYVESQGLLRAMEVCDFEVALKMDTDALIIGVEPERDAIDFFTANPEFGIGGSHRVDCMGLPRGFEPAGEQLEKETSLRLASRRDGRLGLLRSPSRLRTLLLLSRLKKQALATGYEPGEHVLGGSYFLSGELVRRLDRLRLLGRAELFRSNLSEDHLFGLLCYAVGMKLGDLATDGKPLGVRWRGLPCPPEQLVAMDKKVIHSVNYYENRTEDDIRAFFRTLRHTKSSNHDTAQSKSALPSSADASG